VRILTLEDGHLRTAAEAIKAGLLVAFPTETVYGLGADAFNTAALARVFDAKGRPRFDPLIIHIADPDGVDRIADPSAINRTTRRRMEKLKALWPGPLTLILPKRREVPDLATAALRCPDHPAAQALIRLSTGAVAAPSANPFGYLSPTRAEHVRDQLGDRVDFILDGGPTRIGLESTVLDLSLPRPRILRYGGVPREAIEALIGPVEKPPEISGSAEAGSGTAGRLSPGMLKSHYAPRTPLLIHSRQEMIALVPDFAAGYLFFDGSARDAWLTRFRGSPLAGMDSGAVLVLSKSGDMLEAAAVLFDALHTLDTPGISCIHAQLAPEGSLGPAINDRLYRASVR
jgi:L-threonylcarbamoyladenylate synthase